MAKTYKDTPETLLASILSMQEKILALEEEFSVSDLTYEAEMGDGRTIIRANPFVQEYRALVKDFYQALRAYKEISGASDIEESGQLDKIRKKLKVIA